MIFLSDRLSMSARGTIFNRTVPRDLEFMVKSGKVSGDLSHLKIWQPSGASRPLCMQNKMSASGYNMFSRLELKRKWLDLL